MENFNFTKILARLIGKAVIFFRLLRPFSWPASLIPALLGNAAAFRAGVLNPIRAVILLIGVSIIHGAGNIFNQYYDYQLGLDQKSNHHSNLVLVKGWMKPGSTFNIALVLTIIFLILALFFSILWNRYFSMIYALIAALGAYFYTAPPLNLKYRGLGTLTVFLIFGLAVPQAVYYPHSGTFFDIHLLLYSLPLGLITAAILHGNNMRDRKIDSEKILTLARILDNKKGKLLYDILIFSPYVIAIFLILADLTSIQGLLVFITLPLACRCYNKLDRGLRKNTEVLADIDRETARLNLLFGLIWIFALLF